MATLLETRDPKKHYTTGTSTVRALDGVSVSVERESSSPNSIRSRRFGMTDGQTAGDDGGVS